MDLIPEIRGAEPESRCADWKLNAPGIALGEFIILRYCDRNPKMSMGGQVCDVQGWYLSRMRRMVSVAKPEAETKEAVGRWN